MLEEISKKYKEGSRGPSKGVLSLLGDYRGCSDVYYCTKRDAKLDVTKNRPYWSAEDKAGHE